MRLALLSSTSRLVVIDYTFLTEYTGVTNLSNEDKMVIILSHCYV